MAGLTLTETIAAPRERVWKVFTDLDAFERDVQGIQKVERIDGVGFHLGTKWRETRVMFGREATEEMWVTSLEAPERYVVEAASHGAHYTSEYRFSDTEGGTLVSVDFSAEPTTAVGRLLTPLTFKAMRKSMTAMMAADLRDLKAVAERDG